LITRWKNWQITAVFHIEATEVMLTVSTMQVHHLIGRTSGAGYGSGA